MYYCFICCWQLHWNEPTVISWQNRLLIIIHYRMTPFLWNIGPRFFKETGALRSCIHHRIFICWKIMARSRTFLLFLKNFYWVALKLCKSSLTSAIFFSVVTRLYTDLKASQFVFFNLFASLWYIAYSIDSTIAWSVLFSFFSFPLSFSLCPIWSYDATSIVHINRTVLFPLRSAVWHYQYLRKVPFP